MLTKRRIMTGERSMLLLLKGHMHAKIAPRASGKAPTARPTKALACCFKLG